jgi:hypothetical protein
VVEKDGEGERAERLTREDARAEGLPALEVRHDALGGASGARGAARRARRGFRRLRRGTTRLEGLPALEARHDALAEEAARLRAEASATGHEREALAARLARVDAHAEELTASNDRLRAS